jgi:group I intron endonuclease
MDTQHYKLNGVYLIRFASSAWVYIGSTAKGFRRRRSEHIHRLRAGTHANRHLQHAYNLYGMAEFDFTILEVVTDPTQIVYREQHWIDAYRETHQLYNILPEAGTTKGRKSAPRSDETKTKIRAKLLGRKATEEHKQKQRDGWTPEVRATFSERVRGKKMSDQMREKTAERMKGNTINRDRVKKIYNFVSPDGGIYRDITNLRLFCEEHGLRVVNMRSVANGWAPRHLGWTRLESGE